METINTEVRLAQSLYFLMKQVESVAAKVNSWISNPEQTAKYSHALMRSRLVRNTIHCLENELWLIAMLLERYTYYDVDAITDFLSDIMDSSLGSYSVSKERDQLTLDDCARELKRLWLATQTASDSLREYFEECLLMLETKRTYDIPNSPARTLDDIETRIEDNFYWIEEILSELAEILPMDSNPTQRQMQDNQPTRPSAKQRIKPRIESIFQTNSM